MRRISFALRKEDGRFSVPQSTEISENIIAVPKNKWIETSLGEQ